MIAQATSRQPVRPAPNAPGTLGEQFAAIVGFLSLPAEVRENRREDVWQGVLGEVMEHRSAP